MRILLSIFAISILAVGLTGCSGEQVVGGSTSSYFDAKGGFRVDGTTVIDSDGNVDAPITSTTGTFSGAVTGASTLTVTGETNLSTLVFGGSTYTTATGTIVLTAAQMCNNSYMAFDPAGTSTTLTTAASSTLIADCVPSSGDVKVLYIENTADAAETYTVTAGGGIDLIEPSGGDVVIAQNEDARMEIINVNGTAVKIIVTSLQAAD